jgi:hypothetical protein
MSEDKIIAYCGLICNECPAYIAKQTNDDELRKKTAEEWSSEEWEIAPEDLNCDGCTSDGELASFCNVCDVRICATEKGVVTCAHCTDYPCEKLEMPWSMNADAKKTLDKIRESL